MEIGAYWGMFLKYKYMYVTTRCTEFHAGAQHKTHALHHLTPAERVIYDAVIDLFMFLAKLINLARKP